MFALGPDQQLEPVERVVQRADLVDAGAQRVGRDVVAEAVRGRVVGDREVLVGRARRAAAAISSSGRGAVGQRRVGVQVAAQVVELDQLRQPAAGRRRRLELAAALAQLGRDPVEPERRVDLLLGRAAHRLAGRVVEDPVLGDVQAAAHGRLAQRHVVRLGAREVLEDVAELVGLDDPQVDLHARVRDDARARLAGLRRPTRRAAARSAPRTARPGRTAVAMMSRSLTESAQRRSEPATSTRSAAGWARSASAISLGDAQRAREHDTRRRRPVAVVVVGQHLLEVLLDLGAEAAQLAHPARPRPRRAARRASRRRARRTGAAPASARSPAGA